MPVVGARETNDGNGRGPGPEPELLNIKRRLSDQQAAGRQVLTSACCSANADIHEPDLHGQQCAGGFN
jgi:hypothetical protein